MSMIWKDPSEALMPLRQAMNSLFEDSFVWPGRFELFSGRSFPLDVYESMHLQVYVLMA